MCRNITEIPEVDIRELHNRLLFDEGFDPSSFDYDKSLVRRSMPEDDSQILRYIFRSFLPKRHLEFGTWKGEGALCCLQECDASVWTVNLPYGEKSDDGQWQYYENIEANNTKKAGGSDLFRRVYSVLKNNNKVAKVVQTDTLGTIGKAYIDEGYGGRVCQIYADSRNWASSAYPTGFFDTVLVDGGHTEEIVLCDTEKAFRLVRKGGLIMWHDFCPKEHVLNNCPSAKDVTEAICRNWLLFEGQLSDVFWIRPSWILLGVKN